MTHAFACPTCERRLQIRYGVRPAGQVCVCGCGARWWAQTEKHWVMIVPLPQEDTP